MRLIKVLLMITVFGLAFFGLSSGVKAAGSFNPTQQACADNPDAAACQSTGGNPIYGGSDSIVNKVANILAIASGFIAVAMIVWGGLQMVLSGGESSKVANGRNTVIYASIGIVVIVLARVIIAFVVNKL